MMGAATRNGRKSSSNNNHHHNTNSNNNNNFLSFPRDSEEVSAKGGSQEESWMGAVAPFVSPAASLGVSLQTVPRSKTLESAHERCAYEQIHFLNMDRGHPERCSK